MTDWKRFGQITILLCYKDYRDEKLNEGAINNITQAISLKLPKEQVKILVAKDISSFRQHWEAFSPEIDVIVLGSKGLSSKEYIGSEPSSEESCVYVQTPLRFIRSTTGKPQVGNAPEKVLMREISRLGDCVAQAFEALPEQEAKIRMRRNLIRRFTQQPLMGKAWLGAGEKNTVGAFLAEEFRARVEAPQADAWDVELSEFFSGSGDGTSVPAIKKVCSGEARPGDRVEEMMVILGKKLSDEAARDIDPRLISAEQGVSWLSYVKCQEAFRRIFEGTSMGEGVA